MNELIFIIQTLLALGLVLAAFRLGKVWLVGLLSGYIVLMNIFVLKGINLFGFDATGGNALYGAIFLATDLLAEHYGKKEAQRMVRIGFGVSLVFLVMSQFIAWYQPAEFDFAHGALATLFTLTPRIVLGSMIAYLVSQHLDIWLFEKIKDRTKGRFIYVQKTTGYARG